MGGLQELAVDGPAILIPLEVVAVVATQEAVPDRAALSVRFLNHCSIDPWTSTLWQVLVEGIRMHPGLALEDRRRLMCNCAFAVLVEDEVGCPVGALRLKVANSKPSEIEKLNPALFLDQQALPDGL